MMCRLLVHFFRFTLAVVFLFAVASKASVSSEGETRTIFQELVEGSPWRYYGILGVELFLALWLISGIRPGFSALASVMLLSLFTGLIVVELGKEQPAPCGCLSSAAFADSAAVRASLIRSVFINSSLLSCAAFLFLRSDPQ